MYHQMTLDIESSSMSAALLYYHSKLSDKLSISTEPPVTYQFSIDDRIRI
jgi:hypothetical protein